jgi:hypothetical protein
MNGVRNNRTLQRALIPWFVFRQALQKKLNCDPEKWLAFWSFADDGVGLAQDESQVQDVIQLLFPGRSEIRH